MRKIIDSVFRNIVVWFSLILVSFLAVVSFLFTSVFEWDESNQYLPEVIHYKSDIFIITLAVCVFIIFLLYRTKYLERISLISMKIFLIISVLVLSLGWIFLTRPVPVADDMMVSNAAVQFLNNDYSMLQKGGYVYQYCTSVGDYLAVGTDISAFWSRKLSGLSDVKRIDIVCCIWMFVEVVKKNFQNRDGRANYSGYVVYVLCSDFLYNICIWKSDRAGTFSSWVCIPFGTF